MFFVNPSSIHQLKNENVSVLLQYLLLRLDDFARVSKLWAGTLSPTTPLKPYPFGGKGAYLAAVFLPTYSNNF